jgi:hypothetical protein
MGEKSGDSRERRQQQDMEDGNCDAEENCEKVLGEV